MSGSTPEDLDVLFVNLVVRLVRPFRYGHSTCRPNKGGVILDQEKQVETIPNDKTTWDCATGLCNMIVN